MGDLFNIVTLSLFVTVTATAISTLISLPLAFFLMNWKDCFAKDLIIKFLNTFMSMPPVLMGLLVYMFLSRKGPLGAFRLLFTPGAMIIAQTLLIIPIITSLTYSYLEKNSGVIIRNAKAIGASPKGIYFLLIKESLSHFLTFISTGFARGIAEVGAVMMVGGNIEGKTRVMTTYIATETGKGNFTEALILGGILLVIAFIINALIQNLRRRF